MAVTLIQTLTVGAGGAASIDFTGVPQTFTDLVIKVSGRNNSDVYMDIQFNGLATNRSSRILYGNGSSTGSFADVIIGATGYSGWTANTFGSTDIYIPNYSGATNKSVSIDAVSENNGATTQMGIVAGLWASTAAINRVTLYARSGNWVQGSTASLYGVSKTINVAGAKATGGMITSSGGYVYHTFGSSGTFTPNTSLTADMLIIGGGGSGGGDVNFANGGGGAGGVVYLTGQSLTATPYTVTVGAGGAGSAGGTASVNNNGTNSSITGFTTAIGGGGGGSYNSSSGNATAGGNGGSGGGKNFYGGALGTGTAGQGFNGANSLTIGGNFAGGGGGGATSAGSGGAGGVATSAYSVWAAATNTGISGAYAGGGSGSVYGAAPAGGGGGAGGSNGYTNGAVASGSGGGGNSNTQGATFAGGSGIVIVRYAI